MVIYAIHTDTHQWAVYALMAGLMGLFLSYPWYPNPVWRRLKYPVLIAPPWIILWGLYLVTRESAFQKADFFFMGQFGAFFFLQNFFL